MTIHWQCRLLVTAGLLVSAGAVYADRCDDAFESAQKTFESAGRAADKGRFERSGELYKQAAREYRRVAAMKNCRCPKIAGTASSNVNIALNNAAAMRQNEANQKAYKKETKTFQRRSAAVDRYNKGVNEFNRGSQAARSGNWDEAIEAYGNAIEILDGVAASDSEYRGQAAQLAQQARSMSERARGYRDQ